LLVASKISLAAKERGLRIPALAKAPKTLSRQRRFEMRDEEKPFVYYKSGSGVKISPRNAAGWRAFAVWMVALFGASGVFVWASVVADEAGWDDRKVLLFLTLPFLLVTGVWALAMFRYMKARSEIVDIDSLLQIKRDIDRTDKRKRR
jgi:hypothetical protein